MSNDYWRNRAEQDQLKLLKPFDDLAKRQERLYSNLLKDIKKEIAYYVKMFAKNNDIPDYTEALKLLKGEELADFKMSLEEYIGLAEDEVLSKQFAKELENASLKTRFTRLQALELEVKAKIDMLYQENERLFTEELKNLIIESRNRVYYNISTKYNSLVSFSEINDNLIDKLLKIAWADDDINFSERLWKNKIRLIKVLNKELSKAIILGKTNDSSFLNDITKKLDTDKSKIKKIIYTESAYFSEKARKDCYNDLDLEKYEIVGTLDKTTCDICGGFDGKVYEMKEYVEGVTAPIFHPYCRCTTAPYFDDEDEESARFARDENGNRIKVSSSMKYPEFKEKYLSTLKKSTNNDIIIKNDKDIIAVHTVGRLDNKIYKERYKDLITDEVIITDNQIEHIKERRGEDFYKKYKNEFNNIINNPDYIFEDSKKKNTLLVCKCFKDDSKYINIVLKLILSDDNPNFKNSIITAILESQNRFERRLRNNLYIYKNE